MLFVCFYEPTRLDNEICREKGRNQDHRFYIKVRGLAGVRDGVTEAEQLGVWVPVSVILQGTMFQFIFIKQINKN